MSDKLIYIGGSVVAVAAITAAFVFRPLPEPSVTEQASDSAAVTEPETLEDTQLEASVAEPEATPEPVLVEPARPELAELRVEADGLSVIQGKAEPGALVAITIDGQEIERVTADASGNFFAYPNLGFSDGPRRLEFVQDPDGDAVLSPETYLIAAIPEPAPAEVVADAGADEVTSEDAAATDSEAPAEVAAVEAEPEVDPEAEPDAEPEAAEAQPVLALSEEGVRVVQPADTAPDVMSSVALDSITYDPAGEVTLQGRATGEGFVRVYVDNQPISTLPIDETGGWRTDLPDVDTGVYTLRVDEVDEEGDVVSRIETPFLREDPETVAAVMADETADPEFSIATRTVQPGNTLWAIAEERYGTGVLYVQVFEANRDRIRNPDMIFPGQVFDLPEMGQ